MERITISINKYNYLKDDGTYLLDKHVKYCNYFNEGFCVVEYANEIENYINTEGKVLLKNNVNSCTNFNSFGFATVRINYTYYSIDKECNFYNYDKVSFKELYYLYPNKRSELIEIINKYTYFDVNYYFNI